MSASFRVVVVLLALCATAIFGVARVASALELSAASVAQDPPAKAGACKKCKGEGRIHCGEHPKSECELEDAVLYCSEFIDCALCRGAGFVVCPDCKDPVQAEALEKRRADLQVRKVALQSLDDAMKRPLRKAESAHVVVVWEVERMKVDRKVLNAHELMHLCLDRMERVHDDYLARFMITRKEFREKMRFFVWSNNVDMHEGSLRFCGMGGNGPVKLMGTTPSYSVCGSKAAFQDDEHLHRNLVHVAGHLLLSSQTPAAWIGNQKYGWADEGLAHWFEDRYFGICDTYCYQEQNANVDFKGGKFRLAARQLVAEDKAPPIAEVFEQTTDSLTLPMHATAFSYVDFLITRDGEKFNKLMKKLKAKVPNRDALKEVYGMTPMEFEAQWKAWVLATYPTR